MSDYLSSYRNAVDTLNKNKVKAKNDIYNANTMANAYVQNLNKMQGIQNSGLGSANIANLNANAVNAVSDSNYAYDKAIAEKRNELNQNVINQAQEFGTTNDLNTYFKGLQDENGNWNSDLDTNTISNLQAYNNMLQRSENDAKINALFENVGSGNINFAELKDLLDNSNFTESEKNTLLKNNLKETVTAFTKARECDDLVDISDKDELDKAYNNLLSVVEMLEAQGVTTKNLRDYRNDLINIYYKQLRDLGYNSEDINTPTEEEPTKQETKPVPPNSINSAYDYINALNKQGRTEEANKVKEAMDNFPKNAVVNPSEDNEKNDTQEETKNNGNKYETINDIESFIEKDLVRRGSLFDWGKNWVINKDLSKYSLEDLQRIKDYITADDYKFKGTDKSKTILKAIEKEEENRRPNFEKYTSKFNK